MRLRIAVFGGRDYRHADRVRAALARVYDKHGPFVLVHGACPSGADAHAAAWGAERDDITVEAHPADWRQGRGGGPRRNEEMAASGLDGAVGFPGGRGTADMARRLASHEVLIWWPDGQA